MDEDIRRTLALKEWEKLRDMLTQDFRKVVDIVAESASQKGIKFTNTRTGKWIAFAFNADEPWLVLYKSVENGERFGFKLSSDKTLVQLIKEKGRMPTTTHDVVFETLQYLTR